MTYIFFYSKLMFDLIIFKIQARKENQEIQDLQDRPEAMENM